MLKTGKVRNRVKFDWERNKRLRRAAERMHLIKEYSQIPKKQTSEEDFKNLHFISETKR